MDCLGDASTQDQLPFQLTGQQRDAATLLGLSYDQFRGLYRKHQATLKSPPEGKPDAQENS